MCWPQEYLQWAPENNVVVFFPVCSVGMSRVNEAMEDDDEDEELTHTDEGASSWLQSIGLNSKEYRSLDPSRVKLYPFSLSFRWFITVLVISSLFAVSVSCGYRFKYAASWLQTISSIFFKC